MAKKTHYEDLDGRVRTQYLISGTDTFRTSTSKLDPPVRPEIYGLAFQTITKHSKEGKDIRSMFVPSEGYALVECDQAQAESRIALFFANEFEQLALMDKIDFHILTASWINDRTYEQEKAIYDGGVTIYRQLGKHGSHANDNAVGKRRFVEMVYDLSNGEIEISEWKAGKIIEIIDKHRPGIRQVFHKGIIEALHANGMTLVNPWGATRTFYDKPGDELYKMAFAHIKQSTVTGLTQRAALKIYQEARWIRILLESHDSLLFEVPVWRLEEGCELIRKAFEQDVDFSKCSLPRGILKIPCDILISLTSWSEMIKEDDFWNKFMGGENLKKET